MIEHRGVYLRRMDSGKHLIAVDLLVGGPAYLEVPPVMEDRPLRGGSASKEFPRGEELRFGDAVTLRLELRTT